MINKKALSIFLAISFGLTITLSSLARLFGLDLFDKPLIMSQISVLIAMFIPALSALLVQKFVIRKPIKELGFRIGPSWLYLKVYLGILAMYIINYAITWIFVAEPDFSLAPFLKQFNITAELPLPAVTMVIIFSILTFLIAPIFNMIPSLGEEIGWRGFLLPNLEPLGKTRALIFSSMIWALWHTPMIILIGFGYGREYLPGVFLHFVTVTGFGIWVGYVWLKTRSTILASFMHATFNANAYGIWTMVFVSSSKVIIGAVGVIGSLLAMLSGLIALYLIRNKTAKQDL